MFELHHFGEGIAGLVLVVAAVLVIDIDHALQDVGETGVLVNVPSGRLAGWNLDEVGGEFRRAVGRIPDRTASLIFVRLQEKVDLDRSGVGFLGSDW